MDKYGVFEESESVSSEGKQASARPTQCPWCGKPLKAEGSVLLCPEHGSKPFEK